MKKSLVLVLAREAYDRARAHWFPSPAAAMRKALINGNQDPALEAGWKEVYQSFRRMSALLKGEGIPFRLVIFPVPEQVWSTATNISSYQIRLQAITNEMAVPPLDPLSTFRNAAPEGRALYIPWDWRPNPEDHRLAAQAIEASIRPVVVQGMLKHSLANYPGPNRTTPPGA